jgi:putative ABC transport system permease protein
MLRNYIKTAFRSLIKQKIYTAINIAGLAVSITACLLIALYVKHELSYDRFFPQADRIYKMILERKYPSHATFYASIPHSYATVVQRDFPEIENTMHMFGSGKNSNIKYKASDTEIKTFEEDYFMFADSAFFSFFDVGLLKGDKKTALAQPNQVILSATTAHRYFGNEEPLGKVISGDFGELKVTGVFKDVPSNSHLRFDAMCSFSGPEFRKTENFITFDAYTYIKLKPGASAKILESKFPTMVDTYAAGQIERELGQSWQDYRKAGNGYRYFLQSLTSIHLDPINIEFTNTPSGNRNHVIALIFIALLILSIACINFMNLATARSSERAREVGVRKVMGSLKSQLVIQFLTEAMLLSLAGTMLAIFGAYLLLPSFNTLVEKNLQFIFGAEIIFGLIAIVLLVGILAGLYPAFVLSSFNPVVVMKGNFAGSAKGAWLRNGLVVFQFIISIVLIVSTIIVSRQMDFIQKKDLGFNKDKVLMVDRAWALNKNGNAFKEEIKKLPEVVEVTGTSSRVGNRDDVFGQMFQPQGSNEVLTVKAMVLDDDFAEMIGFTLKDGRFFSKETSDSLHILLNESAIKTLGLSDPIGRKLSNTDLFQQDTVNSKVRLFTIIGIVKNFHFQSLHDEITPLVMFNKEVFGRYSNSNYVAIKLKSENAQATISKIESKWKELAPERPFHYEFLDENLHQGYLEEQRSGKMFSVFSGLAIIIACVGLFGLSAYTASLRTKEIGIRKVLGASVGGMIVLLSKDFTKLVLIAFVMASPLAWWMMSEWLGSFAYRIELGAGAFIVAGAIALLIAWLTVSYQSIKAAIVNPVKSLKSE